MKMPQFTTQIAEFRYFELEFEKGIVIFEIDTLNFAKSYFLTHAVRVSFF